MDRSAVMWYFDGDTNARVNRMWINVRCFNAKNIPIWVIVLLVAILGGAVFVIVRTRIKAKN